MEMSGRYPIARREGEVPRLRIQAAAIAADAAAMLDRIGVGPGWHCLDLGCGAGGILELLAPRVAPGGRVVGLDADPGMLEAAATWIRAHGLRGVELLRADAYHTGLPRGAFDLVHVRFLASTAGAVEDLLREALAMVKPGGVLALQEPDTDTLRCFPPHPAWTRLVTALQDLFVAIGGDTRLGQRLYPMLRALGLEGVEYRPFLVGVRSGDPMTDFVPATVESVRTTLLDKGLMDEPALDAAVAACRAHLADPDTVFTTYTVVQAWGRRPRAAGAAG
jgi:SAM-dependent methyltransferase